MISPHQQFSGTMAFEPVAELFVQEYTEPGDLVLDPFAGTGVTMAAAQRLGRRGLGIEIQPELVMAAQAQLGRATVREGDVRDLDGLALPVADLVMTSPPFMTVSHHPQNPLSGYQTMDGAYAEYLVALGSILEGLGRQVRSGGRVIFDVWNFWHGDLYTPLADDLERSLGGILPLEQVIEIAWPDDAMAPVNDRCLVFRA